MELIYSYYYYYSSSLNSCDFEHKIYTLQNVWSTLALFLYECNASIFSFSSFWLAIHSYLWVLCIIVVEFFNLPLACSFTHSFLSSWRVIVFDLHEKIVKRKLQQRVTVTEQYLALFRRFNQKWSRLMKAKYPSLSFYFIYNQI